MNEPLTDFGYTPVTPAEKLKRVDDVFTSVANRYNLMNDLMSFSLHRLWKRALVAKSNVRAGQCVLDIAGGTGDVTRLFSKKVGNTGKVILLDINHAMLTEGRTVLIDQGMVGNISYIQADAEQLPFPDHYFHCVSIAFGLRNITKKENALQEIFRVLKPGGTAFVLEFSTPIVPGLQPLYDAYSFNIIPTLGKWITGDEASYRYLVESIRKHPNQAVLKKMMQDASFEDCTYHNFCGGIVALHQGYKY